MPIIQNVDPFSVASEAVGSYYNTKRQSDLDAQAKAYREKRDARQDMESDRSYVDDHAKTQSQILSDQSARETAAQNRNIAQAKEAFDQQLRPLELKNEQIQIQVSRGQLTQQAADLKLTALRATYQSLQNKIQERFGMADAATAFAQHQAEASKAQTEASFAPQTAQANLDATAAGTASSRANAAATTQRTSQDAQLFPLDVAGKQLANDGQRMQNTFERTQLASPTTDPQMQNDYRAQLKSYTTLSNDYDHRAAANKLRPGEQAPAVPMSPEDFTATLADSVDAIRKNPNDAQKMIAAVDSVPGLSPFQKRQARLALTAAAGSTPQQLQSVPYGLDLRGGSQAGGPFQSVLRDAATRHGVPASIAQRMMGDESSGNPNAVSTAGAVGLLQLEPAAAAEVGVTDRRDPVQNINGGLAYLAKQFKRFGSWPLALAAYNAGPENVAKYGMRALQLPGADPNYVTKILGGL